jgi:hypothetical protein
MTEAFEKRAPAFNELQPRAKLWGTVEQRKTNPQLIALRLLQTSLQDTNFIEIVEKPRGDTQWAQRLVGENLFVYADERIHEPIRTIINTTEIKALKAATQPPSLHPETGEIIESEEPTFEECKWSDGREWDDFTKRRLQALHAQTQLDYFATHVKDIEDPVERELLVDNKCIPYALRRNELLGLAEPIEIIRSRVLTPQTPIPTEEIGVIDQVDRLTPVDYTVLQALVTDIVERELPNLTPRSQ